VGEKNSSITRVWPVFDCLFHMDSSGKSWLINLLQMGSQVDRADPRIFNKQGSLFPKLVLYECELSGPLKNVLGTTRATTVGNIRNAYESEIPPSDMFLKWLIEHSEKLTWPRKGKKEIIYGEATQTRRKALMAGNRQIIDEALTEHARLGCKGSRRKWWAFEGFTSVDCVLETNDLIVLVEGKRTEPVSASTHWYPQRNQVIRNLECAREIAMRKNKNFAVLLCAERSIEIPDVAWIESLPHMSGKERSELKKHFLGCVTWGSIASMLCKGLMLPDTIDDSLTLSRNFK